MSRKSTVVWVMLLAVAVLALGCPKKEPAPAEPEIEMETNTVEPPEEVPPPPPEPSTDMVEQDPLESEDLRMVNEAAVQRGFTPNVFFDFDMSDLRADGREALQANARFLREHPEFVLTIEGHCDERGTNEYNLALGERRANTTSAYLESLGVEGARLRTISYGEERPVCTESTESCWQRNRRAHMVITGRR